MEMSSRNDFGLLMTEMGLHGNGIEIGVNRHEFSKIIADTFPLSKLYLLDSWKNYDISEYPDSNNHKQEQMDILYNDCIGFSKQYNGRVEVIRKESAEGSKGFKDNFFDFIYIDANHTYKYVCEDLALWYPKLKPGGILAGHDYLNGIAYGTIFGVKRAVDEFAAKLNKEVTAVSGGYKNRRFTSWYFIK